ncbi:amino acid ABC transporter permease [Nioella sp.]|uniref:amino acid ABC transporter permease n=1 Tax=Nioella sp. TaxID=1912091 RepID=UPI003A858019
MSSATNPPAESFRLSQLIYDTRYRSMTIQVVAFALILAAIWFLGRNIVHNLEELGKDFNFTFLSSRAGYDINQRLIEYSNDSTHGRAALVGILNTLLVAFLGCITATILGVIAGVLRLSKNWLVGRLMTVYVEGFRNIPLLLWIILIFAVMTESMPQPRSYRVAEGVENPMVLFNSVAITNQGSYIPRVIFADGAFLAFAIALILGFVARKFLRDWAFKRQADTGRYTPTFPITIAIFAILLIGTNLVVTGLATSRDQVLLAVNADDGQTLESYFESGSRVDFCLVPNSASALNATRLLDGRGISYREVSFGNLNAAIDGMASGNCSLLSVPANDAATTIELVQQLSSLEYQVNQSIFGISFGPQEQADVTLREPLAVGALDLEYFEGRAIEVDYPEISERGIPRFEGGSHLRNSMIALWLALSLYTGAFIAENVRAGILAVSRGQTEAAFALGLRPNRTMNLVILPQAMRVIIPPLISQYLNLTKNSSLAIAVGYMDVRSTLGGITINQTGRELEGMLLLGLFYLVTSLVISGAMNIYNNSVKLKER